MIKKFFNKNNSPSRLSSLISFSLIFLSLQLYTIKMDIPGDGWISFIVFLVAVMVGFTVLEFLIGKLLKERDRAVKNSSFLYSVGIITVIVIVVNTVME